MKKIFLFALITFFSAQSFAAWNRAMLRFREDMGRSISVSIDGKQFIKIGKTITVGDVPEGIHQLLVKVYRTNGHGYKMGIPLYQGSIKVTRGKVYYCTVSNRHLEVEENCCLDDYGHWNNNDNYNNEEISADNWNNNQEWNDRQQNNYQENDWNDYNGVMSTGRFQQLIDQIRKASFENSKVSVANQALRNNKINCNQLIAILKEFSFESTKLTFAKDNYKKLVDKRNVFLVNDVFLFQSSKDELNEFLETQTH